MASRNKGPKRVVVLMVPVGAEPYRAEIEDSCEGWQGAIGGRYFERLPIGPGFSIVCADDYHGLEDQPNGCGLYGPYFFVREDVNGHTRSLTEAQLGKCRRYWEARRHVAPPSPSEPDSPRRALFSGTPEFSAFLEKVRKESDDRLRFWKSL